jgi:mono/diheme cytochrome c family protein
VIFFNKESRAMRIGAAAALCFALCGAPVVAQTTGPRNPSLVIPSLAGEDLFSFYCSSCHGRDAKGNGPVAPVLKKPPADLTLLSRRNGGTFPRERLVQYVAGGGTLLSGAHGSNDMPVWGPIFVSLDSSDRMAILRIDNVVQYLESLQAK